MKKQIILFRNPNDSVYNNQTIEQINKNEFLVKGYSKKSYTYIKLFKVIIY